MRNLVSTIFVLASLIPSLAIAQAPNTARIRGVVSEVKGVDIVVIQADGMLTNVHLADNYQVASIGKSSMADIKPGNFIGAGAKPQADGTLAAVQIVIFPEAMRGTGEGHRAWGVVPEATMTNATVAESVSSVTGPLLTLKYKDGEKKLSIPADAAILALAPADKTALVAGVQVQLGATKAADGTLQAARVTIIKDGANPL